MRKVVLSIVTLGAMVSWDSATERAGADGVQAVHHARKAHTPIVRIASASTAAGLPSAAPLVIPAIRFTAGTDPTVARPIGAALPMVAGSDD